MRARVKDIRKLPGCPSPNGDGSYKFKGGQFFYGSMNFSREMVGMIGKIIDVQKDSLPNIYYADGWYWHSEGLDFDYDKPEKPESRKFWW
jgi:hypothetical protein